MGLWYGAEIITHHETEAYESVYDSCVVVHLADVNEVSINYDEFNECSPSITRSHQRN